MDTVVQYAFYTALGYITRIALRLAAALAFNAYLEIAEGRPGTRLEGWARRSAALLPSFLPRT